MAIQRDWFERQADVLVQAIAAALGFKAKGDIQAAVAEAEGALRRTFGADPRLALGLPLEQFLSLVCRGERPSEGMLAALSKFFAAWAELLESSGRQAEAYAARQRSAECLAHKPE